MKKYLALLLAVLLSALPCLQASQATDDTFHITTSKKYQAKDYGNFDAFTFNLKKATEVSHRADSNLGDSLPETVKLKTFHFQTFDTKKGVSGANARLTALIVGAKTLKIRAISDTISTKENSITTFKFDNASIKTGAYYHVMFSKMPREEVLKFQGQKVTQQMILPLRFTCRQVDENNCSEENARSWGWSNFDGTTLGHTKKWAPFARLCFEKPEKKVDYFTYGVIALVILASIILIKACRS